MSTDTAFALGAVALVTPRTAVRLRVFLLTLAVVDDLAALLVIATVYTGARLAGGARGRGRAVRGAARAALRAGRPAPAVGRARRGDLGGDVQVRDRPGDQRAWRSGLATSAYPPAREDLERATTLARSFREQPTPELARSAQQSLQSAISPNERLQYGLHPWTSYVIVPLFALANAGIHLTGRSARRRDHLADHARDPARLRGGQADRRVRRVVARLPPGAARTARRRSPSRCSPSPARAPGSASPSRCWSRASRSAASSSTWRASARWHRWCSRRRWPGC